MFCKFGVPLAVGVFLALFEAKGLAQTGGVGPSRPPSPSTPQAAQEPPAPPEITGQASPVVFRGALRDEQGGAPRPNNLTLDPKYRGFLPIPNTPLLLRFNAEPRVDFTDDNRNSGNPDRFVTAEIPVVGSSAFGGGNQFNINANGSRLSIDVRAPEMEGSPRFYYENDFYGSGGGELPYRLRLLWGKYYNVVAGLTYTLFEDPDAWPDTVDYQGPNAMISLRRPVIYYKGVLHPEWHVNFGIEQPDAQVDTSNDPNATSVNHAPDVGFNIRWEKSKVGHFQLAMMFRDIGVIGPITGTQEVFGWGVSVSSGWTVFGGDFVQGQLTYGPSMFRFCNDDFANNDAAFKANGEMVALPFFGLVAGYTHYWSEDWRSSASVGYVHLVNAFSQEPSNYHEAQYYSLNVIWKIRPRLQVGLEGLYGVKAEKDGATGTVFRLELGLVYSLF
jgi:hypothetical protein